MPIEKINGLRIRYELEGSGNVPLVLVHGSWGSHEQWSTVAGALAKSFRVLSYDRRGHSESEAPSGQGSIRDDVADLAALIEHFDLSPAYVAGNSMGASISIRLACERPDLMRGLLAHEPPLFAILADDPAAAGVIGDLTRTFGAVLDKIRNGDHAAAAEQFMNMALEEGAWEKLPGFHEVAIENAPTFLDEGMDPEALTLDVEAAKRFDRPTMLTIGESSPPMYAPVLTKLGTILPRAETAIVPGAGHVPHMTHANAYVKATTAFIRKHEGT